MTSTTTEQTRGPRPERTYLVGTGDTGKPLHVEIEIRAREGKPDELSISGTYDGGGGQILDSLGELSSDELAPGWTMEMVTHLRSIWEHWHLNGMRAGCSHQRALGWGHGKTIALSPDELTEAQRETLDAVFVEPFKGAIYENSLSAPCPECGYAYGSLWLSEPLPDAVYAFVDSLPSGDTRSPYDIQAAAFLDTWGITFKAEHRGDKGNDWARADQHWRITLKRGRRMLSFDWWNSRAATDTGEKASAYSVLSTLACESGYRDEAAVELELSPSKARALVAFSNRITRFFDEGDMLDALREIQ